MQPLPLESFKAFMEPLKDGDALGLVRDADGEITPTKTSAACDRYNYIITRPMVTDRLFQLDKTDQSKGPWPKQGKGAWRRGLGCSKLNLPRCAQEGQAGESLSMVAGSCVVEYKVPKRWKAMPVLTMRFFSLTVNHLGQFVWPAKFSDTSRALLKKLARIKIQAMLDDPEYPIHEGMRKALKDTTSSDSVPLPGGCGAGRAAAAGGTRLLPLPPAVSWWLPPLPSSPPPPSPPPAPPSTDEAAHLEALAAAQAQAGHVAFRLGGEVVGKVDSGGYWELVLPAKSKRKLMQEVKAQEAAQAAEVVSLQKQLKAANAQAALCGHSATRAEATG